MRERSGLYAIIDGPALAALTPIEIATALSRGGASAIQWRAKVWGADERRRWLVPLAERCGELGLPLVIDDDVEGVRRLVEGRPALRCSGVLGVHLGQEDLAALGTPAACARVLAELREEGIVVGVSTHTSAQVHAAGDLACDYLGFGPVYATTSKARPDPVTGLDGPGGLAAACRASTRPVAAIGGIDAARASACINAGATWVACIQAALATTSPGIEARTRRIVQACAQVGHATASSLS